MRTLIKNGTVIDGTGTPGVVQDVLIEDDRIKTVGSLGSARADVKIDGRGLVVAPGFIDTLNHSDVYLTLFRYPEQESLLWQGVTTVVGGMCGSSLAPLVHVRVMASIQKWADMRDFAVDWLRFGEFLNAVEKRKIGVNFASLVGHATLRRGLVGDAFRALNPEEQKTMEYLLEGAFSEGAFGLSSGLAYSHAKVAPREELVRLLKIVHKYEGIYASHIRGEGEELPFALDEAVAAARRADVPVNISHLKAMGKPYWKLFSQALKAIDGARASGVRITFNCYPYTVTGSVLYTLLPDWVAEGGRNKMLERLRDPAIRVRAAAEMRMRIPYDYESVTIALVRAIPTLMGKTVAQIARNQGISGEEAVLQILMGAEGRAIAFMDVLSKANVRLAIRHKAAHIASDGAGYNIAHKRTREYVHPRAFGAFSRVISAYTHPRTLPLEEVIAKMTLRPAETFGITKRGKVAAGYFADLVLFEHRQFTDRATFANPYQYSTGVRFLFINGKAVIAEGKYLGTRAGVVLRKR
ncbi:MAG: amidohydrolase family protein [bacterium]|nr:amidohydrolase family protein [bacterium]MDZ4296216.1 amidohydrolase family protein [Patescibacteria group bacterium]